MEISWLVLANATKVEIYSVSMTKSKQPYPLIKEFESLESRLKDHELANDHAGQFSGGMGGHAIYAHNDPHKKVVKQFAVTVADYLEEYGKANAYQNLFLVAEPAFMGELLLCLSERTQELIKSKISKNYLPSLAKQELTLDNIMQSVRQDLGERK